MFFSTSNSVDAYRQVGVESDVSTADPHKLILLLFQGAETAIAVARGAIAENNTQRKCEAITKAIDIIAGGLKGSLDIEQGGELAERLDALYDYMINRLMFSNLKSDPAVLDEVSSLLGEIHSAWAEIRADVLGQTPSAG